jgi:hypothetical protein
LFLSLGFLGSSLIVMPQIAAAETLNHHFLIAQQVTDGLPPPPPSAEPRVQPTAPAENVQPSSNETQYLVLVNGSSALLLDQVRSLSPNAFVQDFGGKPMIQAGVFNSQDSAQQQVDALNRQGIVSEIFTTTAAVANAPSAPAASGFPTVTVPQRIGQGGFTPTAAPQERRQIGAAVRSETPAAPAARTVVAQANPMEVGAYYVVIPGRQVDLPEISNQVIRLGQGFAIAPVVDESPEPIGNHVRVGPFVNRRAASRWSDYFRDFGMDARVFYNR